MKVMASATLLLGLGLLSGLCIWGLKHSKKHDGALRDITQSSTERVAEDVAEQYFPLTSSARTLKQSEFSSEQINSTNYSSTTSTTATVETTEVSSSLAPTDSYTSLDDTSATSSLDFAENEINLFYDKTTKNSSQSTNSTDEDVDYVSMGERLLSESSTILNNGIWNFQKETEDGDQIFSRQLDNGNMVYRLTGVVDMPAENLLVIIYDGLGDYPKWNPSLIECRVLEKINDDTDISYTASAPGARGLVASRDFVSLRHWALRDKTYIAASKSIDFPGAPSNPDFIRGLNGPGCMEMRPLSSDPNKTEFRWLLNTKLNGWIPMYIADKAYKKFMTKYMVFLREYCKRIKQRASDSSTTPKNVTDYK